jgi:iron complex outermembrane receptor protein
MPAMAQQSSQNSIADTLPVYSMSEIVIIDKRPLQHNSINFHERKADQIKLLDVRQVDQAFSNAVGLYFSRNSKNENTFLLNGFEQRQINVFLDGVPISVAFDGVIDLSQISGDDIETIRISRGLPSVLYGTNTLGGSVNIITQRPLKQNNLNIRMEISNHDRLFGNLGFNLDFGKLSIYGFASLNKAEPYRLSSNFEMMPNESGPNRENSDFNKKSIGSKVYYQISQASHIGLNLSVIRNEFGVPPNASAKRPRFWRFPKWDKNVISLNSEHFVGSNYLLRMVVFLDQYKNILQSFDDNTYSTQTERYAFTSEYDDYAIGGTLFQHIDLFSFGITESVLTFKRDVHRQRSDLDSDFESYATDLLLFGIEQEINPLSDLSFSLGIDVEYLKALYAHTYEVRDPLTLYNIQISSYFALNHKLNILAATGTKSRFPTLKELYSEHLGRTIANPNLKAERSHNSHFGIEWKNEYHNHQFLLYYNNLYNLITSVHVDSTSQQFQNIGNALLAGINLSSNIQIDKSLLNFNYTYLHARNLSENRSSDYLEYRPVHRFNFLFRYIIFFNLNVQTELAITRDQVFWNPDNLIWEDLNNFTLLNLKFEYLYRSEFQFYLRFDNLLDENYVSEYGLPMPGREIILGTKLGF